MLAAREASLESIVLDVQDWIYMTPSAPYHEPLRSEAISSPEMVQSTNHERVLDPADWRVLDSEWIDPTCDNLNIFARFIKRRTLAMKPAAGSGRYR